MSLTSNSSRSRVKPDEDARAEVTRPVSLKTLRHRGRTHPAARAFDWTPPPAPYTSEGPSRLPGSLPLTRARYKLALATDREMPGFVLNGTVRGNR